MARRLGRTGLWTLVAATALFTGSVPAPQPDVPSPSSGNSRSFGPLTVAYQVDQNYARLLVTLTLDSQLVGQKLLMIDDAQFPFDVTAGGSDARGTLSLQAAVAPQVSLLEGDFEVSGNSAPSRFKGSVTTWQWSPDVIQVERHYTLSPDLVARTAVRGAQRSIVTVTLLAAGTPLASVGMTQASPMAEIRDALILGETRVAAGAKFVLTVPTTLQNGQVFLTAEYQSQNIPPTKFSSAIATWPHGSNTEAGTERPGGNSIHERSNSAVPAGILH